MWFILGTGAIISAILNVIASLKQREAKYFRFLSLAVTGLTVCAFFTDAARMAERGDLSAMMDVLPTLSNLLWVLVIFSIIINSFSLFYKKS